MKRLLCLMVAVALMLSVGGQALAAGADMLGGPEEDWSLNYYALMLDAAQDGSAEALHRGAEYERVRNRKIEALGMQESQTNIFGNDWSAVQIRAALHEAPYIEKVYDGRENGNLDYSIDYYRLMQDSVAIGTSDALERGSVYEECRNQKIRELGMEDSWETTEWFVDGTPVGLIRAAMSEADQLKEIAKAAEKAEAERKAAEEAKRQAEEEVRLMEAAASEYPVAHQVWAIMDSWGYNDYVKAGIIGNMMTETSHTSLSLNPYARGNDGATDYYGLCQWSWLYCSSVFDRDVEGQMEYLHSTIEANMNQFGGSGEYAYFLSLQDAGEAARQFAKYYERPYIVEEERSINAQTAYNYFVG